MNTITNFITKASLYVIFSLWSFVHMIEYKYFTRIEQYNTIVQNIEDCNNKYEELLLKFLAMEKRIAMLEDKVVVDNILEKEEREERE